MSLYESNEQEITLCNPFSAAAFECWIGSTPYRRLPACRDRSFQLRSHGDAVFISLRLEEKSTKKQEYVEFDKADKVIRKHLVFLPHCSRMRMCGSVGLGWVRIKGISKPMEWANAPEGGVIR